MKAKMMRALSHLKIFALWVALSAFVGATTGVVGALFHKAIAWATKIRGENDWLIYLLPLAGVLIALLYRLSREKLSTDTVLNCIREEKPASMLLAPLIFIGSVITHLFGGSAGREGAALQIGGGMGAMTGKLLRVNEKRMSVLIVCGMSGAFSAIFTTPVTAAVFALEIVAVGHIRYFELLPCMVSSSVAYIITILMGNERLFYGNIAVPEISYVSCIKVAILAILASLISSLFCIALHTTEKALHRAAKNEFVCAFLGGSIVLVATLLLGTRMYNGAGMDVINTMLSGDSTKISVMMCGYTLYFAFLIKMLITAVTVGSGFKGGEIVPALFVGSTFGVAMSALCGLDPSFAASVGMVTVFCGIANCPLASIILGAELFGSSGIIYYALACGICFVISGRFGLYKSQRIVYSKYGIDKSDMPVE